MNLSNIEGLSSHRVLGLVSNNSIRASQHLSSGLRITTASDDASGLAISEKMRSQVIGLGMANRNAQDGISFLQVADGHISAIGDMIQRMRELTLQAMNDTNSTDDIAKIGDEYVQLSDEIHSLHDRLEFNNIDVINGSYRTGDKARALFFQVGANRSQGLNFDMMKTSIADFSCVELQTASSAFYKESESNQNPYTLEKTLQALDNHLGFVGEARSYIGSNLNRLEHTIRSVGVSEENISASESRIRDSDMAKEMMGFTKSNMLQQAASTMLAQNNQDAQKVLKLLA